MTVALKLIKNDIQNLSLSEIIGALSFALDLTEGQPKGHCLRSCFIGMHIGRTLGLNKDELHDLYYSLLLKDAGCSSNAARICQLYGNDDLNLKKEFRVVDSQSLPAMAHFVLTHTKMSGPLKESLSRIFLLAKNGDSLIQEVVTTRCERGSEVARELGFNDSVANGIRCLDEHWNGMGKPMGLMGKMIPLNARIALLSQIIDVFHSVGGKDAAMSEVEIRKGKWFDPELCELFLNKVVNDKFWSDLRDDDTLKMLRENGLEPESENLELTEDRMDSIANAFAKVVDAKSSYTAGHSSRVALYAKTIAEQMGMNKYDLRWIHRAALLHDLGKLAVSNSVLDKPDKLSDEEWKSVRLHPKYTEEILKQIAPFQELAKVAGAHHERLDGKGYPCGLTAKDITIETRIITTADVFDALTAARPYRGPIEPKKAIEIMNRDRDRAFDSDCLEALSACLKDQLK